MKLFSLAKLCEYKALSSAKKLHISNSRLIRRTSLMKMLKGRSLIQILVGPQFRFYLRYFYANQFLPFDNDYLENCTSRENYLFLIHKLLALLLGHEVDSCTVWKDLVSLPKPMLLDISSIFPAILSKHAAYYAQL